MPNRQGRVSLERRRSVATLARYDTSAGNLHPHKSFRNSKTRRLLSTGGRVNFSRFMRSQVFGVVALAGLLAGCATQHEARKAEHQTPYHKPLTSLGAQFGALPPVVQSTVLAEAGGAEIMDAFRDTSSGRVVYKIYFREPDVFPPLFVAPDGSVLNPDLTVAVSAVHGTRVKTADVPPKVMKVIEEHAPLAGYSAINKENWGDRVVYIVSFKDEAHYPKLFITADGTLIDETRRVPHAQFLKLARDPGLPIAVGRRAGRAGMQNPREFERARAADAGRSLRGKIPHANQPLGLQDGEAGSQVLVAGGEQGDFLRGGQFVRRAVAATAFQESQGAIVHHDMLGKELRRRPKPLRKQAPETPAADFRARAGKAGDGPPRMLALGMADGACDLQPVAHGGDFAKGHAGLRPSRMGRGSCRETRCACGAAPNRRRYAW